jgi:hypothetical protein
MHGERIWQVVNPNNVIGESSLTHSTEASSISNTTRSLGRTTTTEGAAAFKDKEAALAISTTTDPTMGLTLEEALQGQPHHPTYNK